jgi:hypothetical protein
MTPDMISAPPRPASGAILETRRVYRKWRSDIAARSIG